MDLVDVRARLRTEREERVGSRVKLAELTSLDESTIYRIETDESYIPGIDTVIKLIEAMPGLTLVLFFAQLEKPDRPFAEFVGEVNKPLQQRSPRVEDSPFASPENEHASTLSQSDAVAALAELRQLLADLSHVLADAASGALSHRQATSARPAPSSDRKLVD